MTNFQYLFNSSGNWIAFRAGKYVFDASGNWIGWTPWGDNYVANTSGDYLGRYNQHHPYDSCSQRMSVDGAVGAGRRGGLG